MRIVFLPSSARDLRWFRDYYDTVFPEGAAQAQSRYENIKKLLILNPYIGHIGETPGTRQMHIPKTPFTLIYVVEGTEIQVLRLWDERQGERN